MNTPETPPIVTTARRRKRRGARHRRPDYRAMMARQQRPSQEEAQPDPETMVRSAQRIQRARGEGEPMRLSHDNTRGFVRGSWWRTEGINECGALLAEHPEATNEELAVVICKRHLPGVDWQVDELPDGVVAILDKTRDYVEAYRNSLESGGDADDAGDDAVEAPVPLFARAAASNENAGEGAEDQATMTADGGNAPKARRGARGKGKNKPEVEANANPDANEGEGAGEGAGEGDSEEATPA